MRLPAASPANELPCARRILTTLSNRAYRGFSTPADLQRLIEFYESGRRSSTFDAGIEMALERILASPKFVFRTERDPDS